MILRILRNALCFGLLLSIASLPGQTIDSGRIRYISGPVIDATDFSGVDIGAKANNAFASFGANSCGTVTIPAGTYTFATTIYVRSSCILEGAGRGNDHGPYGTKLLYNGPAATPAIAIMNPNMSSAYFSAVRDLAVHTNAAECPNNGTLTWNAAAAGANKWQCYDGSTFTSPVPHLAGILHGQINPNTLLDGTHITITNVDVNGGGQDGDINQQGGFHFGVWLNGCEECSVRDSYAFQCDLGFSIGELSNGVLFSNITARINRVAGLEYRGANSFTCDACLFESNEWWGHQGANLDKYGAGIRNGDGSTGQGRGASFFQTYFENNDVDVLSASVGGSAGAGNIVLHTIAGGGLLRGKFHQSTFIGMGDLPSSNFIIRSGGPNVIDCAGCSWTPVTEPDGAGNYPEIFITRGGGRVLSKFSTLDASGAFRHDLIELPTTTASQNFYYRGGTGGAFLLDPRNASASNTFNASSPMALRASYWTGSAEAKIPFGLVVTRDYGGADILALGNGQSEETIRDGREFVFRRNGVLLLPHNNAGQVPKLIIGESDKGGGIPESGYNPKLVFQYRHDSNTGAAEITVTRNGQAANQGFLGILAGRVGIGTNAPAPGGTGTLHAIGNTARVVDTTRTPASSAEACGVGEQAFDASYIYICIATNTWKRVALSAF